MSRVESTQQQYDAAALQTLSSYALPSLKVKNSFAASGDNCLFVEELMQRLNDCDGGKKIGDLQVRKQHFLSILKDLGKELEARRGSSSSAAASPPSTTAVLGVSADGARVPAGEEEGAPAVTTELGVRLLIAFLLESPLSTLLLSPEEISAQFRLIGLAPSTQKSGNTVASSSKTANHPAASSSVGTPSTLSSLSVRNRGPALTVTETRTWTAEQNAIINEVDKELTERAAAGELVYPFDDVSKWSDKDTISRFGVEHKWKKDKMVKALIAMANWRKKDDINDLFWSPVVIPGKGASVREGFYGRDKTGRPIYYWIPDPNLAASMLKNSTHEEFVGWHICVAEIGRHVQKRSNSDRGCAIVDLRNIGLGAVRHPKLISILKDWSKIDEAYCPESIENIYAINVPTSISMIWSIISVILDDQLKKKIKFLKKKDELLEFIDPSQLPKTIFEKATGPEDFITISDILTNFREGKGGDLFDKDKGGYL